MDAAAVESGTAFADDQAETGAGDVAHIAGAVEGFEEMREIRGRM